ncbi:MAG: NAD-dependent epimerase/dehydratase family protein [Acidimicrobiales bacterium]
MGRRVLITGLATFWGGRVAQALEADPSVEIIVGLDRYEPTIELERTEYVRSDENYSILSRIVKATKVDTIVHTFLIVDSTSASAKTMHEINVIGTMNLFAAASAPGSTVRTVVVESSTLVYGSGPRDPYFFREESKRTTPLRTQVERTLSSVEQYVRDFAEDNPEVTVSLLRYSNVLGPDIVTPVSKLLELPLVPQLFGFDPRFQFVHEDDVVRSLLFVLDHAVPGLFNVVGDGVLPWTEVAALCGKRTVPLPSFGMGLITAPLRRLGMDLPPELVELMKFGRGVDNRRFKDAGFRYEHTSAGTVKDFVAAQRLRRIGLSAEPEYHYERDVEQFFRHSPAVVRDSHDDAE